MRQSGKLVQNKFNLAAPELKTPIDTCDRRETTIGKFIVYRRAS